MSSWAARAKAEISEMGEGGTAKTDETTIPRLLSVSAVSTVVVPNIPDRVLSVLAVPISATLEKPTDWHALDAAYLIHHFNCPTCIAAGRGGRYGQRCGVGMALWRAYSDA